ncbi:MAG: hypothetical protein KKA79_09470 [Nanoarchaeota archaeon]|nr:hypothetical protein [Nanoarchaeota archaeon]
MKSVVQAVVKNPFLCNNFFKLFIVKYLMWPVSLSPVGETRPISISGLIPSISRILLVIAAMFGVVRTTCPPGFRTLFISCKTLSVSNMCSIISPPNTASNVLSGKGNFSSISCSIHFIPLLLHIFIAALESSNPVTSLFSFLIFSEI